MMENLTMHRPYLVLLLLLTLSPSRAWAQVPTPAPSSSPSPAPAIAPVVSDRPATFGPWWRDSELAADIELDDSTVDQLEQLFLGHRIQLAELAAELDRARAAVDFERHRTEFDRSAVRKAEDEVFEIRGRLTAARTELLVEVRALLSSEQWQQLSDYQARHRLEAPPSPAVPRSLRSGPAPRPVLAPAPPRPASPRPDPPGPPAPPAPTRADAVRPLPGPEAPTPPVAPSAPLPPAPPALSWWTDASIRTDLGLDADQLQALERETDEASSLLRSLQRNLIEAQAELSRLVASQDLDRDAARRQVEHLASARRALLDAGRSLEHRLLDILTPEQRRRLDSF